MKNNRPRTNEGLVAKLLSTTKLTENGCIEYTGAKSRKGYGKISFQGKHYRANPADSNFGLICVQGAN